MSWIRRIPREEATGRVRATFDRVAGPNGEVDNILAVHSLRPHTLEGHMALYKNVLHHSGNRLPVWLLELVGVAVSQLNGCDYCVDHHIVGLRRNLADDARTDALLAAVERFDDAAKGAGSDVVESLDERLQAILAYARRLTLEPAAIHEADLEPMRAAGLDDGEILEVNQVVAYFAYANRTVLGLGVTTDGDVLGLSPATSDASDWSHG